MVTQSGVRAYAQTVNAQVNPNVSKEYNDWTNIGNAVDHTSVFAESHYTRKGKKDKYTYVAPYVVTAHNFQLDIPTNAYIKKVTVQVCMKADSSKLKINPPTVYFMVYGGTGSTDVTQQSSSAKKTGWYNSTYRVYNQSEVSTSEAVYDYEFSGTEWNKMHYPTSRLNHNIFGVDLHFENPTSMSSDSAGVALRWVAVVVDYEIPNYVLTFDKPSTQSNPLGVNVDETYCIEATLTNTSNADGGIQEIPIVLPYATEVISSNSDSNEYNILVETDDPQVYTWACDGEGKSVHTLQLCLKSHAFGLQQIKYGVTPYYVDAEACKDCSISYGKIQRGKPSCFKFKKEIITANDTVRFNVLVDGNSLTDWNNVSTEFLNYYQNTNHGNNLISWTLAQSSMVQGVSIKQYTNNWIEFNVPSWETVTIEVTGCFIPLFEGTNLLQLTADNVAETKEYYCMPSEPVVLDIIPHTSVWEDYWIATELEVEGFVLRAGVKESDKNMIEGACTLKAHIWKDLAYIGCVPLVHSHYEPDHDSTNEGLSESYKNKTYKGKKGEFKEDTKLQIKLKPEQWTTLQGLTKVDKPIPVNTVPEAFEGDVLNFRGWYEITGIKGVKKTNPLWYDGQVELDPLTHNINTRFTIKKGNQSNNFTLSKALAYIVNSGDEFAKYSYINEDLEEVINDNGYFNVDTDGAYIYDDSEDVDNSMRTLIALDNKQYVNIISDEELAEISSISMTWNSTKIEENKENNIERVINILNSDNEPVFKYTYYDYNFDTNNEYYKCKVLGERLLVNGNWEKVIEKELTLAVDLESLQLKVDENGKVIQESEPKIDEYVIDDEEEEDSETYSFNDYVYGTTVKFLLKQNKLDIIDTGYNGQEITEENIELVNGKYKFEANFINHNTDGDSTDVLTFFDFEVGESIITSDLGNLYKDMIISSFPIAGKKILFNRLSQEGTLFYYQHDASEFTYIQEPFYMYFCGVDLQNKKGSSIFDLDNSYTTFYLNNGLVRAGFNRLNGDIYIYKYDTHSRQFIHVCDLQCTNTDFKIGAFSDDKIELKAGTTVYSMYRGHPYLIINHPDEDILFHTKWNTAWAEKFNGIAYPVPIYFNFLNDSNLLPTEIGGTNISKKNITVSDYENNNVVTFPTITLTKPTGLIYNKTPAIFTVSSTILSEGITILVDGEVSQVIQVTNGEPVKNSDDEYVYVDEVTSSQFAIIFNDINEHSARAVYSGGNTVGIAYTEKVVVTPVQAPNTGVLEDTIGTYKLEIVNLPKKWSYMGKLGWAWKLTKGGEPVVGETVEITTPTTIISQETNSDGIVMLNYTTSTFVSMVKNWTPNTYKIGASYWNYENGEQDKIITDVWQDVTVVKGDLTVKFTEAGTIKNRAKWNLKDSYGNNVENKKVKMAVGGKTYTKTTNSNGNVSLLINKKGYKKYSIVIPSDNKFKQFKKSYTETVR